jgi:soluble epoxide hydrolase/lipid-phosphate phosphatase
MSTVKHYLFYILSLFVVSTHSSLVVPALDTFHTIINNQQEAHSVLETQNYEVASGINYEYIHVKASDNNDNSTPTVLFLHGFPSSVHCWRHQIEYFSQQGYGCLAPNLMGYGKTYSPLNKDEYKIKSMVDHLGALLDHLHLDKVFVVGHDWGTRPANRFTLYHPERTLGLVLISVGYQAPAMFDLDRSLENLKKAFGYETLGYWKFFDTDDAATIIETNVESFMDLTFTSSPLQWKTDFAPVGKMRDWVTSGRRTSRASYMTEDDYKIFRQSIIEGMQPKLNWYKAAIANIDWDDVKNIDPRIKRPVLFIGGKEDYVCLIASFAGQKQYIADLEVIELETSHWVMEEKPDQVNRAIDEWIKRIV